MALNDRWSILKQYLKEFFIPLDNEITSVKKMRIAAIVKLTLVVPVIFLLTFSLLITYKRTAYHQAASNVVLSIWVSMFFLYVILNTAIILINQLKTSRILTYICIVIELVSNQLCLYAIGSLTSHTVIFLAICVCVYRVFFDYRISLFSAVLCDIFFVTTVILEFNRVIPLTPYFSSPLQHEAYSNAAMAYSFMIIVVVGVSITFFASNFSMNQVSKLNRYIMDNWKSDLNCLQDFSLQIANAANDDDIINLTFKAIIQAKAFDMIAFMAADDQNRQILRYSFGLKRNWIENYNTHPLDPKNAPFIAALREQKIVKIKDSPDFIELSGVFAEIPAKSIFLVPLTANGLLVVMSSSISDISEHQIQMLLSITNEANMAFQTLSNLSREVRKASTDGLTGLFNRRYFDEQINKAVDMSYSNHSEVSLIMMDVDNFKKYNDTFGHPAGDQLLKKVAETITNCVRNMDIVARYGGEEFVVILRDTEIQTALTIAERIRKSIEEMPEDVLSSKITISLGAGTLPRHAKNAAELLKFADQSLYHAKHTGKNRVCCGWEDESDSI